MTAGLTAIVPEEAAEPNTISNNKHVPDQKPKVQPYKWSSVAIFVSLHIAAIVSYGYVMLYPMKTATMSFALITGLLSGLGMSVGAHRLWSHRSFKARWPLKVWLLVFHSMLMDNSALSYARDHRAHHKYSDTELDPVDPMRGIFHSHIGWRLMKKTKNVIEAGAKLSCNDLYNDPFVMFQHRHYRLLFFFFGVLLPWFIPVYFWNEDPWISLSFVILRITIVLHHIFIIDSLAHHIGYRPYDFRIRPTNHRVVNYLSIGEGNHNYHHVFPYDYRFALTRCWERYDPAGLFIEICQWLGLAYDCKRASPAVVESTIRRKGHAHLVQYDQEEFSMTYRIMNAIFDWTVGLAVASWAIYPGLFFKFFSGRPLTV